MKKMLYVAVAIAAMSSAFSLTSCDKLFGGNDKDKDTTTVVDSNKQVLNGDSADKAQTPEGTEATEADKAATDNAEGQDANAPEADKAEADKAAPEAGEEATPDTPAENK